MEITCPSGLRGVVRKLQGQEANVLADRAAARKGETFDRILRACWVETLDPGPYVHGVDTGSVAWRSVLVCDRFAALVAIRVATYGPGFDFPVVCNRESCGERFYWEIDLMTDLPMYRLPDESRAKLAAGDNRFETVFDGVSYVFRLMTGDDERRAAKLLQQNRDSKATTALATRIVEIDGETDARRIGTRLQSLSLDVQMDLIAEFEEVDGGYETTIEVGCDACGGRQEIELPFGGEPFWLPQRRSPKKSEQQRRKSKRRAVTLATMGSGDDEETS